MADRHFPGHAVQPFLRKNLADQPDILVAADYAAAVDRNAARLLPTVLQGKQRGIGIMRRANLRAALGIDAEHAAFLMHRVAVKRGARQLFHSIFHHIFSEIRGYSLPFQQ